MFGQRLARRGNFPPYLCRHGGRCTGAQLIPGIPLSVVLMAAIAACCAAGFGKPVASLLILLLLADINSPGALFTGILVGYGLRRIMEK